MKWFVTTNSIHNPNKGIILANPTIYEFDEFSGTGNDDEFSYKFFTSASEGVNSVLSNLDSLTQYQKNAIFDIIDPDKSSYEYATEHGANVQMSSAIARRFRFMHIYEGKKFFEPFIVDVTEGAEELAFALGAEFVSHYIDAIIGITKALISEYDPIENYRMEEKENVGSKITITTDNANNVFGFDSSSQGVPSNKQSGTSISTGNKNDNERVLTRAGNIGVTTSQQMIESELRLRKNNLREIIFRMIDDFLGCGIYK